MATCENIDIPAEYEKAKEKVILLEDLLQLSKHREDSKLALSGAQVGLQELSKKLEEAKNDLDKLKANLAREENAHRAKTTEWKEKENKLERVVFKVDSSSDNSSDDGEDLEEVSRLAEENAALFKQKLAIRQLSIAVKVKNPEIESLNTAWLNKKDLSLSLYDQITISTRDLHKGTRSYRQQLENELKSSSMVIGLNIRIQRLKDDNLNKERLIKSQESRIRQLEATNESNMEATDLQQTIIVPICSDFEFPAFPQFGDQQVDGHLLNAYQRGCNAVVKILGPLARAGRHVRSRKLEWERTANKDQKLLELGNMASHYGMALTDATLYQSFCLNKRNDPDHYIGIYGLHPARSGDGS